MSEKPKEPQDEPEYLDAPLMFCRTTRPHSFTRPIPDNTPLRTRLTRTIKRWLKIR